MPAPADLVHEISTTTGTGNLTVSAENGKRRLSDAFGTGVTTDVFDYFVSHRSAAEWEQGTGHMSDANTLVRDTVIASSNSNAAVNFSAGIKDITNDIPASKQITTDLPAAARSALGFGTTGAGNIFGAAINVGLDASVSGNALTIALKGANGSDPSATNPVLVPFRNATATTGTPEWLSVTAATSVTVSSGSTLGAANNTAFRIWIVGFNDGGTFRLGVINPASSTELSAANLVSSTAEGGAGAADSAGVFYSGTAVTSKAYCILGYVEYGSGLATAGTYASAPTTEQVFGPGVPLPRKAPTQQKFETPGAFTWTKPAGCRYIDIEGVGGGGGSSGGKGAASEIGLGGGGAAGTYGRLRLDVTQIASVSGSIGAGGTAGSDTPTAGGAGGDTTFGSYLTLPGGPGGNNLASGTSIAVPTSSGSAGAATGADFSIPGAPGNRGQRLSGTIAIPSQGASNPLGSGGLSGAFGSGGVAGTGYGAGASGGTSQNTTGRAGQAGTSGVLIITEYY